MKIINALLLVAVFHVSNAINAQATATETPENMKSIYDYKVNTIDGKTFDFSTLSGKKVMIVNTASKCGFTPQYKELQALFEQYGGDNFVIIGFPANNFGEQEPRTNAEIVTFCQKNYGVTFPMMEKISVTGKDMAPIYQFLTRKSENGVMDSEVEWNFQKYLIGRKGKIEKVLKSKVSPLDPQVLEWVKS